MNTITRDINTISGQVPDIAIIWLHGLGADGEDFVSAISYLNLGNDISARFVFPTAPMRAVTINNGMQMRSWYDIKAMLPQRVTNHDQLQESVEIVKREADKLVEQGVDASKIIVIGFSQGGAVAYELALTSELKVLGVAAMSTYLPRDLSADRCLANSNLNVLVIHGQYDDVVPCSLGERSVESLQELGISAQWHTYPMAHEVSLESLSLLGEWITQTITS